MTQGSNPNFEVIDSDQYDRMARLFVYDLPIHSTENLPNCKVGLKFVQI